MKNTLTTNDTGPVKEQGPGQAQYPAEKWFSACDLYLFHEGTYSGAFRMLGAHIADSGESKMVRFAVWAPFALNVSVVGDFNNWDTSAHPMIKIKDHGIWVSEIEGISECSLYKYAVTTSDGHVVLKSDPCAFFSEKRPGTASKVACPEGYSWEDGEWLEKKKDMSVYRGPVSIYEVHLGSWQRDENNNFLSYRELGDKLSDYALEMGYTHIELMPVMEHPLDQSWGYQVTGYFSITSRFGTPHDFMYFVDTCHRKGIGVILDWVPAHFPKDAHGLGRFDGTPLYEYGNPDKGEHEEWGTYVFDYGKGEVRSFLISSAKFWIEYYHIDGLRVDAISSMLYLDYCRKPGKWQPNKYGGNENLEAISFIKKLNEIIFTEHPFTMMIAEESTAWPMVTRPAYVGGLGFSHKWNMGWMHDILDFMSLDPIYRKWSHNKLTFSMMYAFSENFILPLSHDEVVHGKRSLMGRMPGRYEDKFAGLRVLFTYMMCHPGKKLLFMGGEFGQFIEWRYDQSLDWNLIGYETHRCLRDYIKELNHIYKNEKALWENDTGWEGFEWIEPNDCDNGVISFIRKGREKSEHMIIICNFTPVRREGYRVGAAGSYIYKEILNSDDKRFGGEGLTEDRYMTAESLPWNNQYCSMVINIPPLGALVYKCCGASESGSETINEQGQII